MKYLLNVVFFLALIALQLALMNSSTFVPQILAMALVFYSFWRPPAEALALALLGGFMLDLYGSIFGFYLLGFLLIPLAVAGITKLTKGRTLMVSVLLLMVVSAALRLGYIALLTFGHATPPVVAPALVLSGAAVDLIAAAVLYPPIRGFFSLLSYYDIKVAVIAR